MVTDAPPYLLDDIMVRHELWRGQDVASVIVFRLTQMSLCPETLPGKNQLHMFCVSQIAFRIKDFIKYCGGNQELLEA